MYTIIITAILLALFFGYREYKYGFYPDAESIFMISFLWILVGSFLGFIGAAILDADMYTNEEEINIHVLNDNNSISGSFFLGSGNIDGGMKYVYYSEENNRFKLNQVDYMDAEIEYTNEKPTVIKFTQKYSDAFINYFAIDFWSTKYLFKIPEGSIANGYNLDAK